MSLTNPNTPVSQQDLQDFYHKLLPYMGGSFGMIANKFSKGDMYSTDEKMIGQWTNGKPLYQKVITGLNVTPSYNVWTDVINVSSYNIDYLLSVTPLVTPTSELSLVIENLGIEFRLNAGKIDAEYSQNVLRRAINILIIQYTKTTDSAISIGDDTDYSTEEKIIGTWIDGKPIYQKTFVGNFTASTVQRVYTQLADLSSLNIDKPINCNGVVKEQSGYFKFLNVSDRGEAAVYTIVITDDKKLSILTSGTNAQTDYIITIQYTKTTD